MNQEVHDTRLQSFLRKAIDELPEHQKFILRSLRGCGSKVIKTMGHQPAVFLLSNGAGEAKFFGNTSCKSAWCCPVCASKKMSKYASDIGALLDALNQKNYSAFMLTLTIPHYATLPLEDSVEILYNTWKQFIIHGNKNQHAKYYRRKNGKKILTVSAKKNDDVFASFCEQFNCTFRVRVGEFTWSKKAGWHPHFHCLFFVPSYKLQSVAKWEERFNARWSEIAKREFIKFRQKRRPEGNEVVHANYVWSHLNDVSKMAYISKTPEGKIIEQKSSDYICGWGADRELTGNYQKQATHSGHFTPYQILQAAADGNDELKNLYLEFCLFHYTHRHARINFSRGCRSVIAQYKNTVGYQEFLKKKLSAEKQNARWSVLFWFTEDQWADLCSLNARFPMLSNILYLASLPNAISLLEEYLSFYDIHPPNYKHSLENHICNKIFNRDFIDNATVKQIA